MVETQTFSIDDDGITVAASLLRSGALVAFPTETVYGLGADACSDAAVAKIFEAKNRPHFNPLISHFADVASVANYVEWSDEAEKLAAAFWPGPLTLVLPLRAGSRLAPLVTAGLPTAAVRVPAHPVAQRLIHAVGGPIAAPSANPSGKVSPTTAAHVMAGLSGRIAGVVDGGSSGVGLESTIVGLENGPILLRPGGLEVEQIEQILGKSIRMRTDTDKISAPGQILSHYAPQGVMRLNADEVSEDETLLGFGDVAAPLNLSPKGDLVEAAANLFAMLHRLNEMNAMKIAVSPIPNIGLGRAINDRLTRAAAPRD